MFDIELDETDPDKLIDTIAALEPTFGGINLEDIKAPECFYIEKKLRERMKIPVFHDDQHGTAIVAAAAMLNGLKHRRQEDRGGQAGGLRRRRRGARLPGPDRQPRAADAKTSSCPTATAWSTRAARSRWIPNKARYAQDTTARTLGEIIEGADIFLGLSAGGVLKPDMVKRMAREPIILALANPKPEIMPEEALAVRPDAIIGTGRSDYPNQVNNVLCFPFIFRGALDVGATTINEEMKLAAVRAIAELAHAEIPEVVAQAYGAAGLRFGAQYLIPKPFDPRLIEVVAPAVAQAAMDSGVATRPIDDMAAYRQRLSQFVYQSGSAMQPVFAAAKLQRRSACSTPRARTSACCAPPRWRSTKGIAQPMLVGRPAVIAERIEQYGLRLRPGTDFECVDPTRCGAFTRWRPRGVLPASCAAAACRARRHRPRCAAAAPCWARWCCAKAAPTPCCAAPSGATRIISAMCAT